MTQKQLKATNDFIRFLDSDIKPEVVRFGLKPSRPVMLNYLRTKYLKLNGFVSKTYIDNTRQKDRRKKKPSIISMEFDDMYNEGMKKIW